MSTLDLLLTELYSTPRDAQMQALAARSAPLLYFDAREPFLPLAAGVTLFTEDGPSPSFDRLVTLRPEADAPPAAMAIEYAIWWDWDIHHLYELEHAWVYLDAQGVPIRVEASWHGKYYVIPLILEDGHPVLLSEPGKHAFAPHPSWFENRQRDFRRTETIAVGHASVLINALFAGKIREQIFDRVLVRGYLARNAFDPAWRFNQRYAFPANTLVPWDVLREWIPRRVNAVLEWLETSTKPEDFRAMQVISASGTAAGIEQAARLEADAVHVPVYFEQNRLMLGYENDAIDLEEAFRFLRGEPMAAMLEISDEQVVDPLAWFVRSKAVNGMAVVLSSDVDLLARYNAFVPGGVTAVRLDAPGRDAVQLARESRSTFVNPIWASERLDPAWIEDIHTAGIGIIGGPTGDAETLQTMQRLGVDMIWQAASAGDSR